MRTPEDPGISAMLMELGRVLRTRRRALRVGQEILGIRARSGQSTISAMENGRGGGLTVETLARLAAGVGLELRLVPRDVERTEHAGPRPVTFVRPQAFSVPARLRSKPSR